MPDTEPLSAAGEGAMTGVCAAAGATTDSTTAAAGAAGVTAGTDAGAEASSAEEIGSMLDAGVESVAVGDGDGTDTAPLLPDEPDSGDDGTAADSETPLLLRRGELSLDAEEPSLAVGTAGSESSLPDAAGTSSADSDAAPAPPLPRAPREAREDPREGEVLAEDSAEEASEEEPLEPLVSANAIGIAEMPEPTPKATARAPTRPI